MIRKALIITALLATAIAPLAASAGEVDNRLHHENARIDQGVRSGALTAGEYRRLDTREDRINAERRRDLRRDDGRLTAHQSRVLNRQENRLSQNIYFDKHNLRRQP